MFSLLKTLRVWGKENLGKGIWEKSGKNLGKK
jgi:hypothetical protein